MMADGAALSSQGSSETKRRLRVVSRGFNDIWARFLHEFRSLGACFLRCLEVVFMLFGHEYRRFWEWVQPFSRMNLAAFRQEFGKVFALESSV